ncbi:MAG: dienelactone hydrolase family protein [Thermoanaerobaculia bacterium]
MKVFGLALSFFFAWSASGATLGDQLRHGSYRVGFAVEAGVSIWYPCAEAGGSAMTLRDYSSDRGVDLAGFMASTGISKGAIDGYLSSKMFAWRDAPPLRRSFPLIILAVGNAQDALDHAVLAEYLSSHGYVIAATPSPMLRKPMKSSEEIPSFAEEQANDLARAIGVATASMRVRKKRIVAVGYSFGARAALRLAMRDSRISGIVSVDGGIGTASGAASIANAPNPRKSLPPVLHFYGDVDPFMKADFAFLDKLPARSLSKQLVHGMRHAHFTSIGFASAAIPEIAQVTKAPGDIGTSLRRVAEGTLQFARRHD